MRCLQPLQGLAQLDAEIVDFVRGDLGKRNPMPLWDKPQFRRSFGGKRDKREEMPGLVHDAFTKFNLEFDFLTCWAAVRLSKMPACPMRPLPQVRCREPERDELCVGMSRGCAWSVVAKQHDRLDTRSIRELSEALTINFDNRADFVIIHRCEIRVVTRMFDDNFVDAVAADHHVRTGHETPRRGVRG